MNIIDIVLGIFLLFGFARGLMKGLIAELASLIALVAGIYGAINFSYFIVDYLVETVSWSEKYIHITAFAITFVLIVFLIILIGKLLTKFVNFIALGILNRLLGGVFGFLKIAFLISIFLLFFEKFNTGNTFVEEKKLSSSILYNPIQNFAAVLLPSILEKTGIALPFNSNDYLSE